MTLYVSSLLIAGGICFFAGIHAVLADTPRDREYVNLAFGCLSLLMAGYLLLTASMYQTESVSTARFVVRWQLTVACLIYPAAVWFLGLYADVRHWRRWLGVAAVLFGGLLIVNLLSPDSLLYDNIVADKPLTLPWGESVRIFDGSESSMANVYYLAVDAFYLWAAGCCIALWRKGSVTRAWTLALYLLIQGGATVHAEMVNRSGKPGVTFDALAFLALVLLMSDLLRRELQRRTLALAVNLDELRAETGRRQSVEADLHHLAYHDHLTGLPNRHHLHEHLQAAITDEEQAGGALILFDLDHFKTINESLGHDIGDKLLKSIAARMTAAAPEGAFVARFGSDEFALHVNPLVPGDMPPAETALRIVRDITTRLTTPFTIGAHDLAIGVSAGIAMFPGMARDIDSALRQADMALHRAKTSGRHAAVVFESLMQAEANRRLLLEKGLRLALERDEFELHYQPQLDRQGRFVGAEALLRWRHPEHGLIGPGEFIPIAEETGLIHAIGHEVLRRACTELETWPAAQAHARISINISPWQLFAHDIVRTVQETVGSTQADPRRITLEITENAFLHDLQDVADKIRELAKAGFHFALDDFGSGYTSLESLKKLPLHELKIDRSFVEGLQTGSRDHFIESMIAIAHHQQLFVVAEGVATEEQRAALADLDCDAIQGYLVSPPLTSAEFHGWLDRHESAMA